MYRFWLALFVFVPGMALSDPAPPIHQAPIASLRVGVFCDLGSDEREPAPDTELGYIEVAPDSLDLGPSRQILPADLGLAFGVEVISSADVPMVEIRITRPGRDQPDRWQAPLQANDPDYSYFAFAFPFEQVPGLYVIEAFAQSTRLYRAEFDVRPAGSMPEIAAECQGVPISRDTFSRSRLL